MIHILCYECQAQQAALPSPYCEGCRLKKVFQERDLMNNKEKIDQLDNMLENARVAYGLLQRHLNGVQAQVAEMVEIASSKPYEDIFEELARHSVRDSPVSRASGLMQDIGDLAKFCGSFSADYRKFELWLLLAKARLKADGGTAP